MIWWQPPSRIVFSLRSQLWSWIKRLLRGEKEGQVKPKNHLLFLISENGDGKGAKIGSAALRLDIEMSTASRLDIYSSHTLSAAPDLLVPGVICENWGLDAGLSCSSRGKPQGSIANERRSVDTSRSQWTDVLALTALCERYQSMASSIINDRRPFPTAKTLLATDETHY